ncbi:MAG: proline dehydrogenase family protein [Bacteroidales bacterium]|nr:proline dehydrogenase family protein [Bacteroidales bacterium]
MGEIDFNDTKTAFISKTDSELRKARLLFSVMANPALVNLGKNMVNLAFSLRIPVDWAIRPTIYAHFVGGRSLAECDPIVRKLGSHQLKSILDYSVEGKHDEASMQATLEETLRSIRHAAANPDIPFAVFKPTAFAPASLLEQAVPGRLPSDIAGYQRFKESVDELCKAAHALDVPLMIDAEDSWYQHLVDETVEEMMIKYNGSKAIVFNTLQMYRHDRLQYLGELIQKARTHGFRAGIKFVRGAYMEKERERALKMNYLSPIQPDKQATDGAFNNALMLSLRNIDVIDIFCGSHNEESNLLLAKAMDENGLAKNDRRIWFAQLYGMSDHISFNLAKAGYNVAKYVPYGPVKSVMPYLFRRAEENTSIAGQTGRELSLIRKELSRRKSG